jgi:lipopolysaccharide transport system ATP-binding protein
MKPVIEIKQLGKKYHIRKNESYLTLRDVVSNGIKNIFTSRHKNKEEFWALQDISLEIQQGERIGIIGKNGAGKSTLLKILSRVTWPTTGEAIIRGRLASLLEVGTGFHPELTGRENIYLNGSILGLKKTEILRQFDAIVDFSGVEKFLDTPLKHYSSGMQLRLAFAVAAHLEPEILLVDEVLAVGDAEFQRKCIQKMSEISHTQGKTIIFVSHNFKAISNFCEKGVYLKEGRLIFNGSISDAIHHYTDDVNMETTGIVRKESPKIKFIGIINKSELQNLSIHHDLKVQLSFCTGNFTSSRYYFDIAIHNEREEMVIHSKTQYTASPFLLPANQKFTLQYSAKNPNLAPGHYYLTIFVYEENEDQNILLWIENLKLCFVNSINPDQKGNKKDFLQDIKSVTYPEFLFEIL